MIEIRPLLQISPAELRRFITGYTSNGRYNVRLDDNPERTTFTIEFQPLDQPFHKLWPLTDEDIERYNSLLNEGVSLGAWLNGHLAAISINGQVAWNRTFWVWEFHVLEEHRRQGVGMALMEANVEKARALNMRTVMLETQNTNATAIRFYRGAGFRLESVDVSFYTNEDLLPGGEVAFFMKRRLTAGETSGSKG